MSLKEGLEQGAQVLEFGLVFSALMRSRDSWVRWLASRMTWFCLRSLRVLTEDLLEGGMRDAGTERS